MLPIPNQAPNSQEEYDYLINATYQNGLEQYEIDKSKAQEQAAYQWDKQGANLREKGIANIEANLNAETIDTPDVSRPLTDAEWQTKWNELIEILDAQLAEKRQQYIEQAISMVKPPQSMRDIEQMYSCYKDMWVQPGLLPEPQGFSYDAFYELADGRIYSVREAAFVSGRANMNPIPVPGGTEEDLKKLLIFYRDKRDGYPLVKIGYELLTLEEAKIAQITEVDAQISENIKSGFEFTFPTEGTLYYSLSETDQLNFANFANMAIILQQTKSTENIHWQAWDNPDHTKGDMPVQIAFTPEDFLSLYTQGALAHIQDCLSHGRAVKYEILASTTKKEVASLVVEPTKIVKAQNR